MNTAIAFTAISMYLILSVMYQLKHFAADYIFQNEYMLGKFKGGWAWVKPMSAHCAVHAVMTFGILFFFCSWLSITTIIFLALIDFAIHFLMDRVKASPKLLGRFDTLSKADFADYNDKIEFWQSKGDQGKDWVSLINKNWETKKKQNKYFWWSLGFDQMVHHITHDLIVYIAIAMFIIWV